jgi:hypothetical protein
MACQRHSNQENYNHDITRTDGFFAIPLIQLDQAQVEKYLDEVVRG